MATSDARQVQMALEPPPAVSITLDVSYDARERRAYLGLTVRDMSTKAPLAIYARPWKRSQGIADVAAAAHELVLESLRAVVDPDPF